VLPGQHTLSAQFSHQYKNIVRCVINSEYATLKTLCMMPQNVTDLGTCGKGNRGAGESTDEDTWHPIEL
jgi:hypothetical protein